MKNKKISLVIIILMYIVAITAFFISINILKKYNISILLNIFISDVIATIIIYIFNLIVKNASVYDPYWSVFPPIILLSYYMNFNIVFEMQHLFIIIPLIIWSLRLTINWAIGFDNLKWEDWRYKMFKQKFPYLSFLIVFTGIMLFPTILVYFGTLPVYYILNDSSFINLLLGGMVIIIACLIQAISDYQLRKFRKERISKEQLIDNGLWKYSRHPNYFGETLIWWGIFIASLNSFLWINLIGAISITLLFLFISIPMMERHIIETRPNYMEYKRKVKSPLIIFFNKRN